MATLCASSLCSKGQVNISNFYCSLPRTGKNVFLALFLQTSLFALSFLSVSLRSTCKALFVDHPRASSFFFNYYFSEKGDAYQITSFHFGGSLGWAGNIMRVGGKREFLLFCKPQTCSMGRCWRSVIHQGKLFSCLLSLVPWVQGTRWHLQGIFGEVRWDWHLKRTMLTRDWDVAEAWKELLAGLSWENMAGGVCVRIETRTVTHGVVPVSCARGRKLVSCGPQLTNWCSA